ncbi:adenine deaminase [bacterium]|nr:adenine deaminase [bacterium]
MSLVEQIDASLGKIKSSFVIKNVNILNFFTGNIDKGVDVAIYKDTIVGIGQDYHGEKELDGTGKYLSPGFIDAHVHIESSMVSVGEYAKAVVNRGTTSVVADPHEIANVLGLDGIRYMLYTSKYAPINVFLMAPSCVPATSFETSGSTLRAFDLHPLFSEKWLLGLGEMMNFPGVLAKDPMVLDKISIASGKVIDGHAPGLSGKKLNAYIGAGIYSDHETTTKEEAMEKLSKGMYIMIREGTATKDLEALIPIIDEFNHTRIMFCTDDRHPHDLINQGHIDYMIKRAIERGITPITAYKVASYSAARYFGLKNLGGIAPGYQADLVLLDSLDDVKINSVIKSGKVVVENNHFIYETPVKIPYDLRASVNIRWLSPDDFKVKVEPEDRVRIIDIVPNQIITKEIIDKPKTNDGMVVSDIERDYLIVVVVERHRASKNIGIGLIHGIGLKKGAIASSVAHDSHNIIAVGTNFDDMLKAIIRIKSRQGGFAIALNNEIIGNLPLPIAGLMTDIPMVEADKKMQELLKITKELGSPLKDPFMQLGFMALPVIPKLKITDKGLFDVEKFAFTPFIVGGNDE